MLHSVVKFIGPARTTIQGIGLCDGVATLHSVGDAKLLVPTLFTNRIFAFERVIAVHIELQFGRRNGNDSRSCILTMSCTQHHIERCIGKRFRIGNTRLEGVSYNVIGIEGVEFIVITRTRLHRSRKP